MNSTARPPKILVIDDEEHLRNLIADFLESEGYEVKTAANGREGLASFQEGTYDVVITDLGLPEMSGLEVAEEIKNIGSATPVVLLTGFSLQAGGERMKDTKVDLVITKPFQLAQVLDVVHNALRIKKEHGLKF
jgi:DNA-binding response OmpR family regulator